MRRAVVVGLGNPVRTDDGVGLFVARAVKRKLDGSEGVEVVELWAGGLRLAEAVAGFDIAVVVDAMRTGVHAPGTVRRVAMDELGKCRAVTSMHDATLPEALDLYRMAGEAVPEEIYVIGVEAADMETLGEELTAPVAHAVEEAARLALIAAGVSPAYSRVF